ncbi:MAG: dephospho-CoA kinase [Deltaproteobacteria bacterium CG12_big_fil_rev_8_21_14_0_65_43_10]|nr:MAG: dephospho-CoA kinase [Deltaproteobacteria bacterium CG12_big_fil_rev_8_21_14_0_65_43_10]PIU86833.1 MAG: dephospho-CoA kinase [Deltaproteobacteria bacterium CG06_land_8_20_14_3_00_44_19]PIX24908.1 MAG: dephospho-CoA kinase [Deltaproteobacteria bacterium CG_4_8_14_3_um_filter_43_13]PIZ19859.1 MAG: dephospho-CoA kinase [Deltaproteobacteria bacterium CG_4_10_14_0_8_um_filter_43_12]PJB41072.1 MAG: dephospho-CoA kinase [Deltaproteobacteria bacterium CG_4_9_14_3_um_filter_44_9]HCX89560.1 deph
MIIGVTGGIASGKSTVTKFFIDLGAYLIDWDVLGHEVMLPQKRAWKGVVDYFGTEILNEDLSINRQILGQLVFNKPEKLQRLNQIVHPEIFKEDKRLVEKIRSEDPNAIIIKDVPLLTAEIKQTLVDKAVVVYATEENQIRRLKDRGFTVEEARRRIGAHVSIDEKMKFADFVIYNDGSIEETRRQVEKIYDQILLEERHV